MKLGLPGVRRLGRWSCSASQWEEVEERCLRLAAGYRHPDIVYQCASVGVSVSTSLLQQCTAAALVQDAARPDGVTRLLAMHQLSQDCIGFILTLQSLMLTPAAERAGASAAAGTAAVQGLLGWRVRCVGR
jgi:hypothetical protein